jgi:hypothetical protein
MWRQVAGTGLLSVCIGLWQAHHMKRAKVSKPPQRSTSAALFIRCSTEEKQLLESAARSRVSSVPGAKFPIGAYALQAALAEARRELGALGVDQLEDERRGSARKRRHRKIMHEASGDPGVPGGG